MILGPEHCDQVRSLLSTELDSDSLPDDTILSDVFAGTANAYIVERVPTAESMVGADYDHIVRAAMYLTASYLAPSLPVILQESFGPYRYAQTINWEKRAEQLAGIADGELSRTSSVTATSVLRPTGFTIVAGGRGR